jgi:hypothetical protein
MHHSGVCIDAERETPNGWLYSIRIEWSDTSSSDHEITLSWVDHEHLVGGGVPPSTLINAVAQLAAEHFNHDKMPMRCDVSSLRRLITGFDAHVRAVC